MRFEERWEKTNEKEGQSIREGNNFQAAVRKRHKPGRPTGSGRSFLHSGADPYKLSGEQRCLFFSSPVPTLGGSCAVNTERDVVALSGTNSEAKAEREPRVYAGEWLYRLY